MLELNKRLKGAVGREREELERRIKRTDGDIDELVYRLYGLTEEEIRVVEGGQSMSPKQSIRLDIFGKSW